MLGAKACGRWDASSVLLAVQRAWRVLTGSVLCACTVAHAQVGESWENSGVVQFFEACMNDLDFIQEQPDEQPYAPLGATAAQKAAAAAAQAEPGFWGPMEGDGDGDDGEVDDGPLFF